MDALKSLIQPLVGGHAGSSVVDGMKLVVLGGTVETARRVSSSAWSHFVNSFFLTAHFTEDDFPYDWLMLWLSRRPEWQRSREFETTTRTSLPGGNASHRSYSSSSMRGGHRSSSSSPSGGNGGGSASYWSDEDRDWDLWEVADASMHGGNAGAGGPGGDERPKTRVVFQPTYDTTHTIFYRGHWLRVRRSKKQDCGSEMLSVSVVARSNAILKQLVLQAKREYEAEAIHRIQIYFADAHGSWRWTDSRHKRPMGSIVLDPGVKEMLLDDARDFLASEKWYADRGIPFRRGYLLHGVPGSGKSSLIHALAGQLALDIYVVSLSASWISDNTLTTLMGRVPARCVLLLEDLDAAFTRSVGSRTGGGGFGEEFDEFGEDEFGGGGGFGGGGSGGGGGGSGGGLDMSAFPGLSPGSGLTGFGSGGTSSSSSRTSSFAGGSGWKRLGGGGGMYSGRNGGLSDMNTLSLSGLLNALDGVAASEGRLLFATTNHLERLDPALSRPGRMDVWVEFKNASKWQAEALFRNFFPCEDYAEDVYAPEVERMRMAALAQAQAAASASASTPSNSNSGTNSGAQSPSTLSTESSLSLSCSDNDNEPNGMDMDVDPDADTHSQAGTEADCFFEAQEELLSFGLGLGGQHFTAAGGLSGTPAPVLPPLDGNGVEGLLSEEDQREFEALGLGDFGMGAMGSAAPDSKTKADGKAKAKVSWGRVEHVPVPANAIPQPQPQPQRQKQRVYVPNMEALSSLSSVPSNVTPTAAAPTPTAAAAAQPTSLWSLASSASSMLSSSIGSLGSLPSLPSLSSSLSAPPAPPQPQQQRQRQPEQQFGASNTAYLPPSSSSSSLSSSTPGTPNTGTNTVPSTNTTNARQRSKPLDKHTLAQLAKLFADGVPDGEFSVAGLQGYLLKHKAQPEAAANDVGAWVAAEREMRSRLASEKEARDMRDKIIREKRHKEAVELNKQRKAQEKKEKEMEAIKEKLKEKEKEEELEKMMMQLKEKEREGRRKERKREKKERRKLEAEAMEGGKKSTKRRSKEEETEEDEKTEVESVGEGTETETENKPSKGQEEKKEKKKGRKNKAGVDESRSDASAVVAVVSASSQQQKEDTKSKPKTSQSAESDSGSDSSGLVVVEAQKAVAGGKKEKGTSKKEKKSKNTKVQEESTSSSTSESESDSETDSETTSDSSDDSESDTDAGSKSKSKSSKSKSSKSSSSKSKSSSSKSTPTPAPTPSSSSRSTKSKSKSKPASRSSRYTQLSSGSTGSGMNLSTGMMSPSAFGNANAGQWASAPPGAWAAVGSTQPAWSQPPPGQPAWSQPPPGQSGWGSGW